MLQLFWSGYLVLDSGGWCVPILDEKDVWKSCCGDDENETLSVTCGKHGAHLINGENGVDLSQSELIRCLRHLWLRWQRKELV